MQPRAKRPYSEKSTAPIKHRHGAPPYRAIRHRLRLLRLLRRLRLLRCLRRGKRGRLSSTMTATTAIAATTATTTTTAITAMTAMTAMPAMAGLRRLHRLQGRGGVACFLPPMCPSFECAHSPMPGSAADPTQECPHIANVVRCNGDATVQCCSDATRP